MLYNTVDLPNASGNAELNFIGILNVGDFYDVADVRLKIHSCVGNAAFSQQRIFYY